MVALNLLKKQTLPSHHVVLCSVYYIHDISAFPEAELFQRAVAF